MIFDATHAITHAELSAIGYDLRAGFEALQSACVEIDERLLNGGNCAGITMLEQYIAGLITNVEEMLRLRAFLTEGFIPTDLFDFEPAMTSAEPVARSQTRRARVSRPQSTRSGSTAHATSTARTDASPQQWYSHQPDSATQPNQFTTRTLRDRPEWATTGRRDDRYAQTHEASQRDTTDRPSVPPPAVRPLSELVTALQNAGALDWPEIESSQALSIDDFNWDSTVEHSTNAARFSLPSRPPETDSPVQDSGHSPRSASEWSPTTEPDRWRHPGDLADPLLESSPFFSTPDEAGKQGRLTEWSPTADPLLELSSYSSTPTEAVQQVRHTDFSQISSEFGELWRPGIPSQAASLPTTHPSKPAIEIAGHRPTFETSHRDSMPIGQPPDLDTILEAMAREIERSYWRFYGA